MARRKDDKRTIVLFGEIEDQLQDFTDDEAGQIFKALLAYANRGEEMDTNDRAIRCLYRTIKASIDRADEMYEKKCETNRRIAEERERRRKEARGVQDGTDVNERERNETNVHDGNPSTSTSTSTSTSHSLSMPKNGEKQNPEPGEREKETEKDIDFSAFMKTFKYYVQQNNSKISAPSHMTEARKEKLETLLSKGFTKEDMQKVMWLATGSPKLNGKGKKGFIPDFDWIFDEKNFVRILEGNFNNKE